MELKLYDTTSSKLNTLETIGGQVIVSKDDACLYIDMDSVGRLKITDWVELKTDNDRLAVLAPIAGKIYYVVETNAIWKYIEGKWKYLNEVNKEELLQYVLENLVISETNNGNEIEFWTGTKAEYDAITNRNPNCLYVVTDESDNVPVNGKDGYTPVRGVDYWTEADKEEFATDISEEVASQLADKVQLEPEFANSIDECTDETKLYVLPDGYIYAYMTKTVPGGKEEVVVPITEGFVDNKRLSVSSGNESSLTGFVTTPFIDFSAYPIDAEIRLSGVEWAADAGNTTGYSVITYDENKAMLIPLYTYLGEHYDSTVNMKYVAKSATDVIFTLRDTSIVRNFKYVRFCGKGKSANAVVQVVYTREKEDQVVTDWMNTGHAFIPADYEERIVTLENDTSDYGKRINVLEANTSVNGIPSYWLEELATKAEQIQIAMENAGWNKSAFLWYTDAHWKYTNAKVSPLLLQYLCKNTSMNKVNFGGDIVSDPSALTHEQIKYVYEWRRMVNGLPNHHSVIGNHDNLHQGRNDAATAPLTYAFLLAQEETPDIVWGGDFYYYIDNVREKTRYLYLDSGRYSLSDDETKFIIDALKGVSDGWHIVVISHVWFQYTSASAPTVGSINTYMQKALDLFDAYNARQSGSVTMVSAANSYDFTDCGGKVEFCIGGHIHVDHDISSTGGIPVIITASDTNQERSGDETEDCGTIGTITESAVYGIIADYQNSKIIIVGVGRGGSRDISY